MESIQEARSSIVGSSGFLRVCGPLIFGLLLFVSNYAGVIGGALNAPEGHSAAWIHRSQDFAQYVTWAEGFQREWLIPSYHAPFITEPAFFNPIMVLTGRLCGWTGIPTEAGITLVTLVMHIFAAYALLFALETFCANRWERTVAFLAALAMVPIKTLVLGPSDVLLGNNLEPPRGFFEFVYHTSDGFFHGIASSPLVTFATATVLLGMGLLARYLQTNESRFLWWAGIVTGSSAFGHPFEFFVLCGAGALALLLRRPWQPTTYVRELAILGLPAVLGISPYIVMTWTTPWIQEVAKANQWDAGSFLRFCARLGLPLILVFVLPVFLRRLPARSDVLLFCWIGATLGLIYVPGIPWSQHLLDGLYYAVGILCARLAAETRVIHRLWSWQPLLTAGTIFLILSSSVWSHVRFRAWAFQEGSGEPGAPFSAIVPDSERELIRWFRTNARPDHLVMAPMEKNLSRWLATVPMHSLASHYRFGITYHKQVSALENIYEGRLKKEEGQALLEALGVRYVVVPEGSPALLYVEGSASRLRVEIPPLLVYEFPRHTLKSWQDVP